MPTESLNLFVVEDDDDIALLMRKSLERAGHQVTRCRTGADALIVLGHTTFDLVLLDQKLPDMAGAGPAASAGREGIAVPVADGHRRTATSSWPPRCCGPAPSTTSSRTPS